MDPVISPLAPAYLDRLAPLWCQLLAHHARTGAHLAALADLRTPEESWRLRRSQYVRWLADPAARVFLAEDGAGRAVGYAMVRVEDAPGSWRWGDRSGVLETLVVDDAVRGAGLGRRLLAVAREHAAAHGAGVLKIAVLAGNAEARRFYEREGAARFVDILVMPLGGAPRERPDQVGP